MNRALRAGLAGMRANLGPGLLLWGVGLALVLTYALVPAARPVYDRVEAWQRDGGLGFSALATGLCGGLLPWLFLVAWGRVRPGDRARQLAFLTVFWIVHGLEVALFYRLQTYLFGEARDPSGAVAPRVVLEKTALDMLVYTPLWSVPVTTLVYVWWDDCRGDFGRLRAALTPELFRVRIPGLVLAGLLVWTPSVCLVYSLPSALQVPIFSVVLCFWVLIVTFVAPRRDAP
jgi:hypothetical protein